MDFLVWIGAAVTVLGLIGLGYCMMGAKKAQANAQSDEDLTRALQRLVAFNMASLFVSAIGLAMVVVGILL